MRRLVREACVEPANLIQPIFVLDGENVRQPIASMPGQHRMSVDLCSEFCGRVFAAGIPAILIFGVPDAKDDRAAAAQSLDGVVCQAVRAIKKSWPELVIITDVCLCSYTTHGHCGVIDGDKILNDPTLEILAKVALAHARAGADVVAPSDMMDGRVTAIRNALDHAGHIDTAILSYCVKYASAFYGPFREAADSTPAFGDRRTYQMDPGNIRESVKLAALAQDEGADMLMVKPAGHYLDVVHAVRQSTVLPLAAYQVSGEYAMIEAAAQKGWINRDRVIDESLLSIRRAGADMVITYYALEAAVRWQAQP